MRSLAEAVAAAHENAAARMKFFKGRPHDNAAMRASLIDAAKTAQRFFLCGAGCGMSPEFLIFVYKTKALWRRRRKRGCQISTPQDASQHAANQMKCLS
jgi:hypothetical protein